jgi:hypothetical protein
MILSIMVLCIVAWVILSLLVAIIFVIASAKSHEADDDI